MIKFLDIQKITESFQPELSFAIDRVLKKGWFLLGEELQAFEKEYAEYINTKHCIGAANGLDALRLILKAYIEMGVMQEGDEVIVPANTYIASILAITDNRLIPVLAEPELNSYNIDLNHLEKHISPKTRAVMVVHLYGRACWSSELQKLAEKHDLRIIEDNAQSAGAWYYPDSVNKKRTGSLGHASGHSFYPGKNLGCLGDGGAITTNDDELAGVIRALANYGSSRKYVCDYQGLNSRLDEIQAAILRVKLPHLDAGNQRRHEIARYYIENIKNPYIFLPEDPNQEKVTGIFQSGNLYLSHVWHLFIIRHPHRDRLQQYLTEQGIQTLIHYPIPPHKQKAYKDWNNLILPLTEEIHQTVLSLPMSPVLTNEEVHKVTDVINSFKE